jgi:putative zinc finger protein
MNTSQPPTAEHREIWELLPWHVNGRLSEPDGRRVEAHLRVCGACRDECAAQRQIYQVIAADTAVAQMPMAGLNKLRQRIERTPVAAAAADSPPQQTRPAEGRRRRAAAIAASLVAATAAVSIPATLHWQAQRHVGPPAYYTVTAAAAPQAGAVIRAVFAPTVTLSELQRLLDDAHLRIVSGPTEAGVYSLAMSGPQSIDWSLRKLRGRDTVRFAESIGPVSGPAPSP